MNQYRLELLATVCTHSYFDKTYTPNYRHSPYYVIFNENHQTTIINTLPIYIFIVKYQHISLINYPLQLSY